MRGKRKDYHGLGGQPTIMGPSVKVIWQRQARLAALEEVRQKVNDMLLDSDMDMRTVIAIEALVTTIAKEEE